MYQAQIKGDRLYHSVSEGYGASVELFGDTSQGETPMSLVNIALASCVTMCVQGYYKRRHQLENVAITVDTIYDEGQFHLKIQLPSELLAQTDTSALQAYANTHCRVKQLLREDIAITLDIVGVA